MWQPDYPDEYDLPEDIRSMQSLWRAVITQALQDAASGSKKPEWIHARGPATAWLRDNSVDFQAVCHLAGRDPEDVRRKASQAAGRGYAWRNDKRMKRLETPT